MTTPPDQPTVQQSVPQHPIRPPVNAGWAVVSLLFFWPLSFSAFTHAFNVYPLWADGDVAGSRYASDRVKRLGQISLWIAGGYYSWSASCTRLRQSCGSPTVATITVRGVCAEQPPWTTTPPGHHLINRSTNSMVWSIEATVV